MVHLDLRLDDWEVYTCVQESIRKAIDVRPHDYVERMILSVAYRSVGAVVQRSGQCMYHITFRAGVYFLHSDCHFLVSGPLIDAESGGIQEVTLK